MIKQQYPILWEPGGAFIQDSHLTHFQNWLHSSHGLEFQDYEAFWKWSCDNTGEFWSAVWEYFEIMHDGTFSSVLSDDEMPNVRWFEGTSLNYSEHIFRKKSKSRPAFYYQDENESYVPYSWEWLENEVLKIQQFLVSKGVKEGDRVVAYLPNSPYALVVFYAVNSLGAIWSCCSPDFGATTVIDRFAQIEPKILFATDGYQYNGKTIDRSEELSTIRQALNSLDTTVLIPFLDQRKNDMITWDEIPESGSLLRFKRVPFSHPIWILYSSGTTGKPKAITHSHGGVLLEHLKYIHFHNDVREGENFFWYTTTGWMMWNFLQASLLAGASAVLVDGSPGYPDIKSLWKLAKELPIHHFGTSAPFLTACMKKELDLLELDLPELRSIGSTGAPLPPEAFEWVYQRVSKSVWLCSMSGGTDVCTAFVGGIPSKPVRKGLIQGRALGCSLVACNDEGKPVDEMGEMTIDKPMPCMPVFFWNDHDGNRYSESYFSKVPGKWMHGDWVEIFEDGSLRIEGRSDATLNRKGIRIGTAEIYSALNDVPGLEDSLVINIELPDGSDMMPLFVKVSANVDFENLKQQITANIRDKCSPRHVPDHIMRVPDIPYTLSGKKMEVPVKKLFMGKTDKSINKESIRNPEAMEYFENNKSSILDQIN